MTDYRPDMTNEAFEEWCYRHGSHVTAPAADMEQALRATRTALAAAEAARDEAHREIGRVIDRLDEFAPHNTGKGVAESVEELRTRLCVVRAEIEAKGGWRERLHAAEARAAGLEEALRAWLAWGMSGDVFPHEWSNIRTLTEQTERALAAHGGKGTR